MSDLINGREMLKRYQEDLCYDIACKDCSMCTEDGGCRVEEWIDKFPSADRPQGEWIDSQGRPMRLYESYSANCSACGEWSEYLTEYCPHCGAKMKGAEDE